MAIQKGLSSKKTTTIGGYSVSDQTIRTNLSGGGSSGGGTSAGAAASDEDVLSAYIDEMYARFAPQEAEYDAKSEDEIRTSVAAWLRPSYDQAIANRQEQTLLNKANLDADAIARGMGASTYVTDMKNRQQNAEAGDIASLEADYGAALSKYVLEGVDSENDRKLEVEMFNAQRRQSAYDQAYEAALALFARYKKGSSGSKQSSAAKTTLENCEAFLSTLSGDERKAVYEGSTAQGAKYRAELLASVGAAGYVQLMGKYPGSP